MKKSMKLLMMLMMAVCLNFASCDKNDRSDEPGNSTTENDYGQIKPTGLKMANLYTYEQYGPAQLNIPGFPPLTFDRHPSYTNIFVLYSEGGGLLDCGITESMDSFTWSETKRGFGSSVDLIKYGTGGKISYGLSMIYRVKISKLDEYPERFAYARIRLIDFLYSNSGNIIGCALEYESPYTPL